MARQIGGRRRQRGHIRRRGNSFQVLVYAGTDPLTGKPHYLTESASTESEAQRVLTRLLAGVDQQRNARTKATFGAALDAWLRVHGTATVSSPPTSPAGSARPCRPRPPTTTRLPA